MLQGEASPLRNAASLCGRGQEASDYTLSYHAVNPNSLTETFFTFGEFFFQQVSLGQRQVVPTGGTSLEAQQLVGKGLVNKLEEGHPSR